MEIPENNKEELETDITEIPELPPVNKSEIRSTVLPVILTEVALTCIMLLVYLAIGRFTRAVLLGAVLGTAAMTVNFLVMAFSVLRAEKSSTPAKGELAVRGTYVLRMVIIFVVLVLALKTGYFDVIAVLLPLCFMRISIFVSQLITNKLKKEERS